jgi:hypothetical protein
MTNSCVLIVAKSPVPGMVKTRLCPPANYRQAAEIAASALLDTLNSVRAARDAECVVALTGELENACQATEIAEALARVTVIEQRGDTFAERLANAHADVARQFPRRPVVQIGMDTPQVNSRQLEIVVQRLNSGASAILGPATDGGWWLLGLHDPLAGSVLRDVPMSRSNTARQTINALRGNGIAVEYTDELSDVDTMDDALTVAELIPGSRFARSVAAAKLPVGAR